MSNASLIGSEIDNKYRILSELGSGGFGCVYKAEQLDLSRTVAIKIMHAEDCSPENKARFLRESKILSGLANKHIVGIYSVGTLAEQFPYMVMEYLEGKTLSDLLNKENTLSEKRMISIAIQACDAMSCAHNAGIIHRDLKPQNIMLIDIPEPDSVKILDFGLSKLDARSTATDMTQTKTGSLIGTPQYMSPEACSGQITDQRSDIYSLGCILYECLSGSKPFDSDNPLGILYKQCNEIPAPISSISPSNRISKELESIVFKCLQKEPKKRYQAAEDLLEDLTLVASGRSEDLNLEPVSPDHSKTRKSSMLITAITIASLIVLISAGSFFIYNSSNQSKNERTTIDFATAEKKNLGLKTARTRTVSLETRIQAVGARQDALNDRVWTVAKAAPIIEESNKIIALASKRPSDKKYVFAANMIKGNCYRSGQKYDEAMESYRAALKDCRTSSGQLMREANLANKGMADIAFKQNKLELCESLLKQIRSFHERTNLEQIEGFDLSDSIPGLFWKLGVEEFCEELLMKIAMERADWKKAIGHADTLISTLSFQHKLKVSAEWTRIDAYEHLQQDMQAEKYLKEFAERISARQRDNSIVVSSSESNTAEPLKQAHIYWLSNGQEAGFLYQIALWCKKHHKDALAEKYFSRAARIAKVWNIPERAYKSN